MDIQLDHLPFTLARWAAGDNLTPPMLKSADNLVLKDDDENLVVLFRNQWSFNWEVERNKRVTYLEQPPA